MELVHRKTSFIGRGFILEVHPLLCRKSKVTGRTKSDEGLNEINRNQIARMLEDNSFQHPQSPNTDLDGQNGDE